jgi:hypothetical protein
MWAPFSFQNKVPTGQVGWESVPVADTGVKSLRDSMKPYSVQFKLISQNKVPTGQHETLHVAI